MDARLARQSAATHLGFGEPLTPDVVMARFQQARGKRIELGQQLHPSRLAQEAAEPVRPIVLSQEEAAMDNTAIRGVVTPPTGEDPFKRLRELGEKWAERLRRRFASRADAAQNAQPASDQSDALGETAKRAAITATQAAEPEQPAQTPIEAATQTTADAPQVAASGQDATQRLTPDARTRHVRQQDPLSTPTQRFVGFNGTLYMPTAKQPMPGAQMIVGEPGDSALNNAPTTQHPISQPLAQPVQSESGKFPVAAFVAAFPLAGPLALAHKMGLIKYDVIQVLRGGDE